MRIHKPTYSKPLPPGAKVVTKKGVKFAKYKAKGRIEESRLTQAGDKILCEVKTWMIEWRDAQDIKRTLKAYTNERETQKLAGVIEEILGGAQPDPAWIESLKPRIRDSLIEYGLINPQRAQIGKPLTEHIEEFISHLRSKERSGKYLKETQSMLNKTFAQCGFVFWSDIEAKTLKNYLDARRDQGRGISKARYNRIVRGCRTFCRWMIRTDKATVSPIEYVDGMDHTATDPRHHRRALPLDEFKRFLAAALTGPTVLGMSGPMRNFVYRIAAETGLRSIDIRRLKVKDLNFAERKITIKAADIKNKTASIVYLRPSTALELQQHCSSKMPHAPVFNLPSKTQMIVKADLEAAGLSYCENGLYFDFHALRHQTASMLAMNPDNSETVRQAALRHKTPQMTRLYSHAMESQQRQAVEGLPDLMDIPIAGVRTGTDVFLSKSCRGGIEQKSPVENNGISSLDSIPKTPLGLNNEGMVCPQLPQPSESNPIGQASQPVENTPLIPKANSEAKAEKGNLVSFLVGECQKLSLPEREQVRRMLESE